MKNNFILSNAADGSVEETVWNLRHPELILYNGWSILYKVIKFLYLKSNCKLDSLWSGMNLSFHAIMDRSIKSLPLPAPTYRSVGQKEHSSYAIEINPLYQADTFGYPITFNWVLWMMVAVCTQNICILLKFHSWDPSALWLTLMRLHSWALNMESQMGMLLFISQAFIFTWLEFDVGSLSLWISH
jgi:hypothetical protein